MMKKSIVGLLLAAVVSGCASNVDVAYPVPAGAGSTGIVLVRFTEPMRSVHVQVDGLLVVEDRHTERVEIRGVPTGRRVVTVAASESSRSEPVHQTELVTVEADQAAVFLIATPPRSTGYWISSGLYVVAYGVLMVLRDDF